MYSVRKKSGLAPSLRGACPDFFRTHYLRVEAGQSRGLCRMGFNQSGWARSASDGLKPILHSFQHPNRNHSTCEAQSARYRQQRQNRQDMLPLQHFERLISLSSHGSRTDGALLFEEIVPVVAFAQFVDMANVEPAKVVEPATIEVLDAH